MRVTLIYNPKAGDEQQTGEDLADLLRAAGHVVERHSSKDEHLAALLDGSPDLVAIAGGDGTISKVARIMAGRGIPLAALPTGTANNISRTLGVTGITLERQIAAWPSWRKAPLDIGLARGPWGSRQFVESVGMGLLAWGIPQADSSAMLHHMDDPSDQFDYVRAMLADRVKEAPPIHCRLTVDGKDISGDYLLIEAMNIRSIGPNLELASDADPGDGMLDVVAVPAAQSASLLKHFRKSRTGSRTAAKLPTYRVRELRMEWMDFDVHFDDDVWPDGRPVSSQARSIDIKLEDQRVEFLVPRKRNA
jgi:diacylglycerol kinase family enzyme